MYYELPGPIAFGICGALAGWIGGGFNSCFPACVGAATGGTVGCVLCIISVWRQNVSAPPPVAVPISSGPVVIQNIYITYNPSGSGKDVLPVATVVKPN
jgi:hypothetical protein